MYQKHQATGDEAAPAPCLCPDLVASSEVCSVIGKILKLVGKKAVRLCCCGSPSDIHKMLGVGDADWPHALNCGPCTRGWPSPCWCDQQQHQPLVAQCAGTKSLVQCGIVCLGGWQLGRASMFQMPSCSPSASSICAFSSAASSGIAMWQRQPYELATTARLTPAETMTSTS